MKKYVLLFSLMFTLTLLNRLDAQIIAEFDRASMNGCVTSPGATYTVDDLSATALCRGWGLTMNVGNDYNSKHFDSTNASAADAEADGEELTFAVTPDQDYEVEITQVNIRMDRSNSIVGPTNYEIQANDGTNTIIISTGTVNSTGTDFYIPLATPITSSSTVAFKILAWGAEDNHGTFDVEGSDFGDTNILDDPGIQLIGSVIYALPVDLINFTGEAMDQENKLTWTTASEENTEWHLVERSLDGSSDWKEIGRVEASGTSAEILSYEYMDVSPLTIGYYRLKSVDYDGYTDMSSVVRVERERVTGDVSIYPNPTKGSTTVEFELSQSETVSVTLTDLTGKVISHQTVAAARGTNTHTLDMSAMPNGVYFMTMETSLGPITDRIVKN